jgi:hypothetical protein
MEPAKEIITRTGALFKCLLSGLYLRLKSLYCASLKEAGGFRNVKFNVTHKNLFLLILLVCYYV